MNTNSQDAVQFGKGLRDHHARKNRILSEAARAFADDGVQQVSLANLAKRLGITKAALYHYVSGKDEIITEILDRSMARMERLLDRAQVRGENGAEKLMLFVRNYCIYDEFDRCLTSIDLQVLNPESRASHTAAHRKVLDEVTEIVSEGIDDGSLGPCNARLLALTLIGALNGVSKWYSPEGELSIESITEEILQVFLRGILPDHSRSGA